MNNSSVIRWLKWTFLSVLLNAVPASALAHDKKIPRISPIEMTANAPGIEISGKTIDRWVSDTGISSKELSALGLQAGKLGPSEIAESRAAVETADAQGRAFVEFVDQEFGKSAEKVKARVWSWAHGADSFAEEISEMGRFEGSRKKELRRLFDDAATAADAEVQSTARFNAHRLVSEARQSAVQRARGYRLLAEALDRESGGLDAVENIGMIIEIGSSEKQPTISPVSRVGMDCKSSVFQTYPAPESLVFTRRKLDCNDSGVCRVESIAEVTKGPEYEDVYKKLKTDGRNYLDDCLLRIQVFVDGEEVTTTLPGLFTSHQALQVR